MIDVKCVTPNKMLLSQMTPFQGDLKKRSDKDVSALAESLVKDGLIMPFAIWLTAKEDGTALSYILDGHGRREALLKLAQVDADIITQEFPIISVEADTEDEARKALLQISSAYGKVTKQGAINFTKTIPNYKAPILSKIATKPVNHKPMQDEYVIVRLRVKKDMVSRLSELLSEVKGIEVL